MLSHGGRFFADTVYYTNNVGQLESINDQQFCRDIFTQRINLL